MRMPAPGPAAAVKRHGLPRYAKPVVFLLCLVPITRLVWGLVADTLGANPIDAITDTTGTWTLRFLAITLAVTPVRKITGFHELIRFRRMFGLFAFFHGTLHFFTYVWLDQFFDFSEIVRDVGMRPFITAGFTAFVLMIPLALTSTSAMIRRLGGRRWQMLHRLVYLSAIAGVVHYWWLVKADLQRPQIYATIIGLLLLFRIVASVRRRSGSGVKAPLRPRSEEASA
jgi:sulfoxide reductase heme-binding subunit YedZ